MKAVRLALVLLVFACGSGKQDKPAPPPSMSAGSASAASSGSGSAAGAAAESATVPTTGDPALAAYEAKDWATCAKLYAAMAEPDAQYNAACCLAMGGQKDAAFATLERVIAGGFRDLAHLQADPDLASLHDDPRWAKALASVEANVAAFEKTMKEPALRRELLALREEDQAARQAMIANPNDKAASERVAAIDAKSTARMKAIVAKHGWPGKSLVGEDGARTAWLLVQHADRDPAFQKRCLALLEQAYKAGEAREIDYAYLYDRVAVAEGRPQRYGTQFRDGGPQPIEDEANVDARRKAIGLPSMAEYAKQMERMYGKPVSSTVLSGSPAVASSRSGAMAQQMKPGAPKPDVTWTKGPAVTSGVNDLVAWFAAQQRNGEPRMTRVPIVLTKGDVGWSNRGVKIGALEVYITDAALGQSIAMRALNCQDPTCAFIVEGFWRGQQETGYHYEVRNAPKRPATTDELAAFTHLEVEGASGN